MTKLQTTDQGNKGLKIRKLLISSITIIILVSKLNFYGIDAV